jgi:hypothetical protein
VKHAIAVVAAVILLFTPHVDSGEKKTLTFTLTVRGEMEDGAATKAGFRTDLFDYVHLSFTNYDASDGEKVIIYHGQFRTTDEAKRYFDWMFKRNKRKAAQVKSKGDKTDRDGKTVGRRAEFLLKDEEETEWIVMWAQGVHFILISAPTIECAEEVERQSTK